MGENIDREKDQRKEKLSENINSELLSVDRGFLILNERINFKMPRIARARIN
jgi:hypothetical protein